MIDLKERIIEILKKPKVLVVIGIFGMMVILVSTFFDGKTESNILPNSIKMT